MGTTQRREREREEVRRKILDAARDLFMSEGYANVTMRRIADAIEYSPTTIYHHFEDKEDLVKALCQEDFSELLRAFESQPRPDDPVDWLRQLGKAYAAFGVKHPNHYRFMFMTSHQEEKPAPAGDQTYGLLREAVTKAVATGRLRDLPVDDICQILWSCVHGVTALLVNYGPEFPHVPAVPELVDRVCENTLRGLLREPDVLREG